MSRQSPVYNPTNDPFASSLPNILAQQANSLGGNTSPATIQFAYLLNGINYLTNIAKSKIAYIQSLGSAMSIGDMFDLQMAMNMLSQFSEMSSSVISSANTSAMSMARNAKT